MDIDEIFQKEPEFISSKIITSGLDTLQPACLQLVNDSLYVCYKGKSYIDIFDMNLEKIQTIHLSSPEEVFPASFCLSESNLFVADNSKGALVVYDRFGRLIRSFGLSSDNKTRLDPFAMTYYGGVLYVSDLKQQKVLAVSMVEAQGVTEPGELILSIPKDDNQNVSATAIYVTFDGRMIIGDNTMGEISVYTCEGTYIYNFDSVKTDYIMKPFSFASDNLFDPDLKRKDTSSFDPSGIRYMGRIHVTDAGNGQVHMFNPVGEYVNSYPNDNSLKDPYGIAINIRMRTVFISEPSTGQIKMYRY